MIMIFTKVCLDILIKNIMHQDKFLGGYFYYESVFPCFPAVFLNLVWNARKLLHYMFYCNEYFAKI